MMIANVVPRASAWAANPWAVKASATALMAACRDRCPSPGDIWVASDLDEQRRQSALARRQDLRRIDAWLEQVECMLEADQRTVPETLIKEMMGDDYDHLLATVRERCYWIDSDQSEYDE